MQTEENFLWGGDESSSPVSRQASASWQLLPLSDWVVFRCQPCMAVLSILLPGKSARGTGSHPARMVSPVATLISVQNLHYLSSLQDLSTLQSLQDAVSVGAKAPCFHFLQSRLWLPIVHNRKGPKIQAPT